MGALTTNYVNSNNPATVTQNAGFGNQYPVNGPYEGTFNSSYIRVNSNIQ
jgi:hypothetical protein